MLPDTLWQLLSEAAVTTGRTRIEVLQRLVSKTGQSTSRIRGALSVAGAVPVVAKPFLDYKLAGMVRRLNETRGAGISPAQSRQLSDWILTHTGLIQRILSSGKPDRNITRDEWASLWAIFTPDQVLKLSLG